MTIIVKDTDTVTVEEGDSEIIVQTVADSDITGVFVVAHGSLDGLGDDDHPQYLKRTETIDANTVTGFTVGRAVPADALFTDTNASDVDIKAAYERNSETNAYTDTEQTKLSNISITQPVNLDTLETDSHTHSNKATLDSTTAVFTSALETKLNGIETSATQDRTAGEIESLLGITGTLVDTTSTQSLTNKTLTDLTNDVHAHRLHAEVRNQTGGTLYKGQPVSADSYIGGELVERVIATNNTAGPANYILGADIANGVNGMAMSAGILDAIDTTSGTSNFKADAGAWSVKDILYPNSAGKLTNVEPTTGYIQPIAMVLRAHATEGALHVLAADPRNVALSTDYGKVLTSRGDNTAGYGELVWKDLVGIYSPDSGGALPTNALFIGSDIDERSYGAGDASDWVFHMPHDYAIGTDIYIHVHWGHNGTAISGTMVWTLEVTHASRLAAVPFGVFSTPISTTINNSGTVNFTNYPRYCHAVEETQLSAGTPSGSQLDTDDLAPDDIIKVHLEATTIPSITGSPSGGVDKPYLFQVDIHYQANMVGTKNKDPDFYT
jgi:hypothetical protein